MTPTPTCRICGRRESEHHDFEPLTMPEGCVCDPDTWASGPEVPGQPCERYSGDGKQYCGICGHDRACHAGEHP